MYFSRKAFLQFGRLYLTLISLLGKDNFRKIIKQNRNVFVELIENFSDDFPIAKQDLLRFLMISKRQYAFWLSYRKFACDLSLIGQCFKRRPKQISYKEIIILKKYMNNSNFKRWCIRSIWGKAIEIEAQLQNNTNNYEAVLFQNFAYAFGLKVNADIFKQIASNIDYKIISKIRQNELQLEALFFGISSWLENPEDDEMKIWKREYEFLKIKYNISPHLFNPKFSRLRPPNFPTIRWSQLANLYHKNGTLFSKIIEAKNTEDLYEIFSGVKASKYWDNHFNFGKISPSENEKYLTKDFIDLIIINAILPIKYTYHKNSKEGITDEILQFYADISAEKNTIISSWEKLGVKIKSTLESQAYLYHYKNFCLKKDCLNCSIGFKLLQKN